MWKKILSFFNRDSSSGPTEKIGSSTHALSTDKTSAVATMQQTDYIFLDTETTGLNHDGADEVLEIAIIDASGRTLLNTLVRPLSKTEWPQAQAVHGIRPQDVINAPTLESLLPKIAAICANKTVVCYNAPFDAGFFSRGFFSEIKCAMREFAEINPDSNSWLKLADAASLTNYQQSGSFHRALADAQACRHIWLIGIPQLEQEYPPLKNTNVFAALILDGDESIPIIFNQIFPNQIRFLSVGDQCKFWMQDDLEEINIYRPRTVGGYGKIATCTKEKNPVLFKFLSDGHKVKMQLEQKSDDGLTFTVLVQAGNRIIRSIKPTGSSIACSPIDNEIFNCFIAERSGMCEAIGAWEDFRQIEAEISQRCKAQGGRFYKSSAKGAKFAIIFSPYAHDPSGILKWIEKGYKVTTFDKALIHFGLEEMWNIPRYLAHVEALKHDFESNL